MFGFVAILTALTDITGKLNKAEQIELENEDLYIKKKRRKSEEQKFKYLEEEANKEKIYQEQSKKE